MTRIRYVTSSCRRTSEIFGCLNIIGYGMRAYEVPDFIIVGGWVGGYRRIEEEL